METHFEKAFVKALKKHASIRKDVERKVRQIMEHPIELGEPLRGNFRGFYSCRVSPTSIMVPQNRARERALTNCRVSRNFIMIYLYCSACRRKGDDAFVLCSDCADTQDATLKFVLLGPHDEAYRIK